MPEKSCLIVLQSTELPSLPDLVSCFSDITIYDVWAQNVPPTCRRIEFHNQKANDSNDSDIVSDTVS